jgi:hypothetical protein
MTAQAGERLIFNGEESWMAVEPLNYYLKTRDDIKFVSPSTACWRGYYGQWEIKNNKLYLIELQAYIEGYEEVGLNYIFPNQKEVFADWFNGKIRIPQGKMLEYVHMGYASLYDKDLILVIKNGVLLEQYEIDNAEEYQERLRKREKEERERPAKEAKKKKEERMITLLARTFLILVFIGICFGIFYLIKWGTILGYIISIVLISSLLYLIFLIIKTIIKNKRKAKEMKEWGLPF